MYTYLNQFKLLTQLVAFFVCMHSIGLKNDNKLLMKLIEQQLHQIHAETWTEGTATQGNGRHSDKRPSIFSRVNHVAHGSPASDAVGRVAK